VRFSCAAGRHTSQNDHADGSQQHRASVSRLSPALSLRKLALVMFYISHNFLEEPETTARLTSKIMQWLRVYGVYYSLIEGLCVRRRHPTYEIFYAVHLLFILYIVTVGTFDHMQQTAPHKASAAPPGISNSRISAIGQRHLNHHYKAKARLSSATTGRDPKWAKSWLRRPTTL
jgi:predicted membrane protein